MKAEELRIGNYVKCVDGNTICIDKDEMIYILSNTFEVEPIPLSEEVLLKCGFERSEIHENFYFIKLNDWTKIYVAFHEKQYVVELSVSKHSFCPKVNCLHQLQNLYCALTGEELEVEWT